MTDLGEQNQRLGKQLAEAEEAALDLRAQVGHDADGDVGHGFGDGKCGWEGHWLILEGGN